MALKHLLYRCPICGADPTLGRKDHAHCTSCGRHFHRGPAPALVDVTGPEGVESIPIRELVEEIARMGGPFSGANGDEEGPALYASRVRVRRSSTEVPVRLRGQLLGFAERLERSSEMRLQLTRRALELLGASGRRHQWNLMDLRAVQASSSTLQIYTVARELVHFRFLDASSFRWEALLQETLRAAYRSEGMGEILEFQPRICVR